MSGISRRVSDTFITAHLAEIATDVENLKLWTKIDMRVFGI